MTRRFRLACAWSLGTTGAIAAFWAVWHLATGGVPAVESVRPLHLPFAISHWWDAPVGGIWAIIIVSIFTSDKVRRNEGLGGGLNLCLAAALGAALVAALAFGMTFGMVFGLACGAAYGLVVGAVYAAVYGLIVGIAALCR